MQLVARLPQRAENKKNFDLLIRMLGGDAQVAAWSSKQQLEVLLAMAQVYARAHAAALPYYLSQQLAAMPVIAGGVVRYAPRVRSSPRVRRSSRSPRRSLRRSPRRRSGPRAFEA